MPKRFDAERDLDDVDLDAEGMDADYGELFDLDDFAAMGIDPETPTSARPGSEEKVLMLSARYAAGLPLWHNEDCYDHGPQESELMGAVTPRAPIAEAVAELVGDNSGEDEEEEL